MLNDNRENCGPTITSSCVPYTGYVSDTIKTTLGCKPNVNDVLWQLQVLIDKINTGLGVNTGLDKKCLTFTAATVKQSELNQILIDQLCLLRTAISTLPTTVDPNTIRLAVDLLCLQDDACDPKATYSLQEIIVKLITAYCGLLDRVTTIENFLNI